MSVSNFFYEKIEIVSDWTKIASRADFTYVYTYISDNLIPCSSGFLFVCVCLDGCCLCRYCGVVLKNCFTLEG